MSRQKLIHLHSATKGTGPDAGVLEKGEIAVGYKTGEEGLYIENASGDVVTFKSETYTQTKISESAAATLSSAQSYTDEKIKTATGSTAAVQTELDATQVGAGLAANGSYTKVTGDTILSAATSLANADTKLADAIRAEVTRATGVESGLRTDVDAKVSGLTAGNGITVGTGTKPSVAVKLDTTGESFLSVAAGGVKLSGVQSAIDTAKAAAIAEANKKVASVAAGDASITVAGSATAPTVAVKIDATAGNSLKLVADKGLRVDIPAAAEYTIATATTTSSYLKSYKLMKGSSQAGVTIDIPKDLVVSKGEVKEVTETDKPYSGAVIGDKYIELTIANGSPLYIPAKSLVDVYTAADATIVIDQDANTVKVGTIAQSQVSGLSGALNAKANQTDLNTVSGNVSTNTTAIATLNGTGTTSVTGKINTAIAAEVSRADAAYDAKGTAAGIKTTIDAYTVNGKKISANPVLSGADVKTTGYAIASAYTAVATGDTVNAAIGKIEKRANDAYSSATAVTGNALTGVTFNGTAATVANKVAAITGTGANIKATGYAIATANTAVAATDTINAAIGKVEFKANKGISDAAAAKSAADAAQSAANGKVASVKAGNNSITVGGTTTAPTVAVKIDTTTTVVSGATDNAIKVSSTGIYIDRIDCGEY